MARVFITGRRQAEQDKAVTAIGSSATAVQGDTSNLSDLDRIYATIKDKAGHADVLAVNARYYEFGSFGEITEEHFDKTFNTNVRGLLFTVQKAALDRRGVGDPRRLDRLDQRLPVLFGVQCEQGL
jgi:NAD(P)-dependent dehydrogenase (short-subunit alcohol dehydrogenase family)